MKHRQPKVPLALRITAAGCIALWLAGVSACNLTALFCCVSHESETVAHADHEHSHATKDTVADTNHAHAASDHDPQDADGHESDKHDSKEGSCCSTLEAVVQTAKPVVLSKSDFHPIPFLCVFMETHAASLTLSENPPNRQAKKCDRVFTPEVCLGPAHRSHAPPAFV